MGLSYQLIYVCFQGCVNLKYGQMQDFDVKIRKSEGFCSIFHFFIETHAPIHPVSAYFAPLDAAEESLHGE